jgi:2,3-bisphosphoglycerate-independent phosphoglycerate mutase
MKYIIILGDGMSDHPVSELGNKTPLQCAKKPTIDFLAQYGINGMVKTIPNGMSTGSDTANMSVLGYDPRKYYSGRSPIEAVSMGIDLKNDDVSFRCNLVTLSEDESYFEKTILDHSSDEISTEEAGELIETIQDRLGNSNMQFYKGVSYRHCLVWNGNPTGFEFTPPHDILDRKIKDYLPTGSNSKILTEMMVESHEILKNHPINIKRKSLGLNPANSIWLWGDGKRLSIPSFWDLHKLNGAVISAVDLIKGIGICAGMKSIDVEGATGNIHTNFSGKANAALEALESGIDFVYVHLEAPDECGHRKEIDNKVKSISMIDNLVVKPILNGLNKYDNYRVLILPDHPTPLNLRTHTNEPVPFVFYEKKKHKESGIHAYDEFSAAKSDLFINEGHELINLFISGDFRIDKI